MLGPTGAGKSAVAMIVAERCGAEIVSVDSMQVYRGMDVGTAKASADDQARVRHHMLDVVDPADSYSVAEFKIAARAAMEDSNRPQLVVGGSGLHFRSLVDPLDFAPTDPAVREAVAAAELEDLIDELMAVDAAVADRVDLANPRRVTRAVEILRITGESPSQRAATPRAAAVRGYVSEVPVVAVGIDPGDSLRHRVESRFDRMLESGLVEEVESLLGAWGETASQAVGYREMARVITGEWESATARSRAIDATNSLARRQRTYFRRDPRVVWLGWDDEPSALADAALARFEEAGWIS